MITIYDYHYGRYYRNVVNVKLYDTYEYTYGKYRIEFCWDGSIYVIWLCASETPLKNYILLNDERFDYNKIRENKEKFIMFLNNENTKAALEALE
jgi:hypothetical protein